MMHVDLADHTPDSVLPPDPEFADQYQVVTEDGARRAATMSAVFVGLARDCGAVLPANLWRIEEMGRQFRSWSAVVVENDSTDNTKEILDAWARSRDHCHVLTADNGRPHLHGFEKERMHALAEYRGMYHSFVREHYANSSVVVVLDLDVWGGYGGLLNGIGWLGRLGRDVGGMASTSVFQARVHTGELIWLHYDQFAWRWQGWRNRMYEPWWPLWLPPVGSRPIEVCSSFGAMAVYRTHAFLASRYWSDDGDIEHVGLHRDMADAGYTMWHNPSQRVVMLWEPTDAGCDGDDQRGAVPG